MASDVVATDPACSVLPTRSGSLSSSGDETLAALSPLPSLPPDSEGTIFCQGFALPPNRLITDIVSLLLLNSNRAVEDFEFKMSRCVSGIESQIRSDCEADVTADQMKSLKRSLRETEIRTDQIEKQMSEQSRSRNRDRCLISFESL